MKVRAGAVIIRKQRSEITAAAEPAGRGYNEPGVHMRGWHMWVLHVGDQRNATSPESAIGSRTRNVGAKLFGKFAMHDGYINPDLLKHAAMHQAHLTTTAALTVPALPGEGASGLIGLAGAVKFGLDGLEGDADIIAQGSKPAGRSHFTRLNVGADGSKVSFANGGAHPVAL